MLKPYLTVTEVATLLKINAQTVYRYVYARKIPFIKVGRKIRFSEAEILAWLAETSYSPSRRY